MRRLVLLAAAALHACAPAEVQDLDTQASTQGRLVIVGGALQATNAPVYEAVVEGRSGEGPVCVVPTASSDAVAAMQGAVETLAEYASVGSVRGVLISTDDPARARNPSVAEDLLACSGFYFTGGSQSRILDVFLPAGDTTPAYRALWQRWQEGAVVAGSSAGAAMMSRTMISGGSSDEALSHGVAPNPDTDGVQIRPGMGFFGPLLDQHFLARGRIGRLLVSVIDDGSPQIGFGIDENTALVVDGDSALVLGASGVVVVDGRAANPSAPYRATGITLQLASTGDVIDLRTLGVHRSNTKTPLPATSEVVEFPEDPFDRWAFLHLVADLAASSIDEAAFELPDATLRIVEAPGISASSLELAGGAEATPLGLSAGPFKVDLLQPGS